MKKRGMVLLIALFFLHAAFAHAMNVTTDGSGYVLFSAPEVVSSGEGFKVEGEYFFLNQLVTNVSVSLVRESKVYAGISLTPDMAGTFSFPMTENRTGAYSYELVVVETSDRTQVTRIPFAVRVGEREWNTTDLPIYKGIPYGSTEFLFDDLSTYEPVMARGNVHYIVNAKRSDQVDCSIQDNLVLFIPAQDFSGNAECSVKATFGNRSRTYVYKILVGNNTDIIAWEQKNGKQSRPSQIVNQDIVPSIINENTFETSRFQITVYTDPTVAIEGTRSKIIVEATAIDLATIRNVDYLGLDVDGQNVSIKCDGLECSAALETIFQKQGMQKIFVWVNFNTTIPIDSIQSYTAGWNVFSNGTNDLFVYNKEAFIIVKSSVSDIDIPYLGPITNPDNPEQRRVAQGILQEYQRKKRISMNTDDELKRISNLAKDIALTKTLEHVVRVNSRGDREDHTVFHVTIEPKRVWTDWLIGKKAVMNVTVFEHIAKDAASDLSHIRFQNKEYDIIVDDPLVVWHLDSVSEKADISYEVDRATDNQGNTIVTGHTKRGFPNVVFAIILIPLCVVLVIYFDRFKKHPTTEIETLKDRPPDYRELEEDTFSPEVKDVVVEERPPETVNNIGDFDRLLDAVEVYIERRLKKGDHREMIKQELVKANWPADIVEKLVQKQEKKL